MSLIFDNEGYSFIAELIHCVEPANHGEDNYLIKWEDVTEEDKQIMIDNVRKYISGEITEIAVSDTFKSICNFYKEK